MHHRHRRARWQIHELTGAADVGKGQADEEQGHSEDKPSNGTGNANVEKRLAAAHRPLLHDHGPHGPQDAEWHGDEIGKADGRAVPAAHKVMAQLVGRQDTQNSHGKRPASPDLRWVAQHVHVLALRPYKEHREHREHEEHQVHDGSPGLTLDHNGGCLQEVKPVLAPQHGRVPQAVETGQDLIKDLILIPGSQMPAEGHQRADVGVVHRDLLHPHQPGQSFAQMRDNVDVHGHLLIHRHHIPPPLS